MIFNFEPKDWKDLQQKVGQVFEEMGCNVEVEKDINTVRGRVSIDVYVEDKRSKPTMIYLSECKYWNNPVPQSVVHSFQSVVSNIGANLGYIISRNGFQSGAYEAASNTNIVLLTWNEFQALLFDSWRKSMFRKVEDLAENFTEYTDIFSGPPRDSNDNIVFFQLLKKYQLFTTASRYLNFINTEKVLYFPINCVDPRGDKNDMKEVSITNYRDYFDILIDSCESGNRAFIEFRAFLREKHGRD